MASDRTRHLLFDLRSRHSRQIQTYGQTIRHFDANCLLLPCTTMYVEIACA